MTGLNIQSSLPSCHLNFCSSDNDPLPSPPPREGACSRKSYLRSNNCHCERQNGASQSHNIYINNEITTSNASHSPRNDIENLCNTQVVDGTATFPLPQGREAEKSTSRFTLHPSLKKRAAFTLAEGATHVATSDNIRRAAFTLAEVLITLGIIGVVAAMTMPSLIQKQKEKEYAAKLKKFNSMMSQAVIMAINEEGPIENWGLMQFSSSAGMSDEEIADANESRNKFFEILSKYLKVVEYCPYNSTCEEWDRHSLDGTAYDSFTKRMVLADGTMILGATILSPQCNRNLGTSTALQNICGEFFVDVNGKKGPNATGKDVFMFYYTKYGVTPVGTKEETNATFETKCNRKIADKLNGYGCAAWVIYNENMDYLHCDDLSWDGKTRCK